jgi:hypothetical protein
LASANYTFLSWYRTGLGSVVKASTGGRATLKVTLSGKVDETALALPGQDVELIGPGDIIGIDPRSIVRVEPRQFTTDFEPNYLPAIEFFDEDYPWRYSPRPPEVDRLHPWIALIVVEESEIRGPLKDQGNGLPRSVVVDSSKLPPAEQMWAWAHAHLNGVENVNKDEPLNTANQIAADPAASCSRVVAARQLLPLKSYRAFLVPTFETGRRAGLLSSVPLPDPFSWGASGDIELPVYYEWSFRTGEKGDFKELAERLRAEPADPNVGRRPLDMSEPLEKVTTPPILNIAQEAVLDLEGALQVPSAVSTKWEPTSKKDFQTFLADLVNLADAWKIDVNNQVVGAPRLPNGISLPVIVPPAYGNHHANVGPLLQAQSDTRWLEQIDLHPPNRAVAAFGTLVVQKNQEEFMARAWKQYGELFEANKFRARAQLYREILAAIETKHLQTLRDEKLLSVTAPVHARVLATAETKTTVFGRIQTSALPNATIQPPMRRLLRDKGPLVRRFGRATPQLSELIKDVGTARRSVAPLWTQPTERLTLSTPPPASFQREGTRFLGTAWDDRLKSILIQYRDTTLELAVSLPELNATARLVQNVIDRGESEATVSASRLTPNEVTDVRTAVDFRPSFTGRELRREDLEESTQNRNFTFIAWNFRQAALNAAEVLSLSIKQPDARPALDINRTARDVRKGLAVYATVAERVSRIVKLPSGVTIPPYDPLETIMVHPRFDDATYEHLIKISEEYLVPNLNKIENNSITLLEVNWQFIESFLVGLNHEMARELLWRGYPTDRRGSYFRLFWDVRTFPEALDANRKIKEEFLDIHPIHGWRSGGILRRLGINRPDKRPNVKNLVLVIRGDLLRRYPNTHVYAVRADSNNNPRTEYRAWSRRPTDQEDQPASVQHPVLFAKLGDDIYCYGFNLEETQAIGQLPPEQSKLGWYFALAERYGEPRFGLNSDDEAHGGFADQLSWHHLNGGPQGPVNLTVHTLPDPVLKTDTGNDAKWGADAADMGSILLRKPYRVFYHASQMIRR